MQEKANQTRTGFSLLTIDQIQSLFDAKSGYLSRETTGLSLKDKKTLVLDVDETILSASPWAAEVCVGDIVQHVAESSYNWTITGLTIGMTRTRETVVMGCNHEIRKFFAKHVHDGVYITNVWLSSNQADSSSVRSVSINDLHCQFVPCFDSFSKLHSYNLRRTNMAPVSFFCEGYVIRLRPNLATFLSFVCKRFRVVIFTAAVKHAYSKVLKYLKRSLSPILGGVPLWEQALFREDCDRVGKHYHKDITKFGVDLSQIVIIDDKHRSFRGFEPNAIQIAPYAGKPCDDHLLRIMGFLQSVADARDVRYPICGIREEELLRDSIPDTSSSSPSLSSSPTITTNPNSFDDGLDNQMIIHQKSCDPYKRRMPFSTSHDVKIPNCKSSVTFFATKSTYRFLRKLAKKYSKKNRGRKVSGMKRFKFPRNHNHARCFSRYARSECSVGSRQPLLAA